MDVKLIGLGLVAIGFLVCLGFSFKVWRWFHAVMVLFVFGMSCWGIFLIACVLKTKSSWQKKHTELSNRKILAESEYTYNVRGAVNKVKEQKDNLQDVDSMLTRLLLDRGRVWRETKPQGVQANSVLVDT